MILSPFTNALSANSWSNFGRFATSSVAPWAAVILGTGATLGLAGLAVHRFNQSNSVERDLRFEKIKERVSQVYGYVFGGFVLTGIAAAAAHISGFSLSLLQNPYLSIPVVLGIAVSLSATMWTDKDDIKAKHIAWGIFNFTMGMMLSPLGFFNQKIVAQAAAISLGLGGCLTFIAYKAPDKKFLQWEGPLMSVLTGISIASCIALFAPRTAFAYGVDRVSLYGGLGIYSILMMASTQRLIEEAEKQTKREFDPINSSLGIYIDGLSIFVRILRILSENKKENN